MWGNATKLILIGFLTFGLAMGISVGVMSTIDDGDATSDRIADGGGAGNQSDAEYGGGEGESTTETGQESDDDGSSEDDGQEETVGDNGSDETSDESGDEVDGEPALEYDVTGLDVCGLTCRVTDATLANTGDGDARNVTAETAVFAGGEKLTEETYGIGTVEADERQTRSTRIDVGTVDGYVIQDNDGRITIETTLAHEDGTEEFVDERNVFVADGEGDTVDGDFEIAFENVTTCSVTCRAVTTRLKNNGGDAVSIDRVEMTVRAADTEIAEQSGDGGIIGADGARTRTRQFEIGVVGSTAIARNGGFVTIEFTVVHEQGTAEFRTKRNVLFGGPLDGTR